MSHLQDTFDINNASNHFNVVEKLNSQQKSIFRNVLSDKNVFYNAYDTF